MPPPHRASSRESDEIAAFLAAQGVPRDARILDVPCGIGRRAFELAEHGFRVTAVDANEIAIDALKGRVPDALSKRLTYRAASKDTLPGPPVSEPFDVILCLDHALSRDPPEDDREFLARMRGHLPPQGFLLVEFLHRDFFATRPRPFAYHVVGEVEQHEFRTFDASSGILDLRWRFYQREGIDLRFRGESSARLQLLPPHEARQLLESAGWRVAAVRGGWGKEPLSSDRRKFVLVATPSARS